jgi:hypothetical protein
MGHVGIVIVEPMDVERAGMAATHRPVLPGAGRGRGAAVGWDFGDCQRLAAVLKSGVDLGDVHDRWRARIGGRGQGRAGAGRQARKGVKLAA